LKVSRGKQKASPCELDNGKEGTVKILTELGQRKDYIPEIVTYLAGMVMSVALVVYTYLQPWAYRRTPDGFGLAVFPVVFLVLVFILSFFCFRASYRDLMAGKEILKGDVTDIVWRPTVGVMAVSILTAWAVTKIDPLVLVAVYSIVVLLLGGVRNWILMGGIALGLVAFVYVFVLRISDVFFPVSWFV
jgi:hypothetical protein